MASILLLGQDKDRASGLRSLLRQDGHQICHTRTLHDWREREREVLPDLVIAEVDNPSHVLTAPGRPLRGFSAALLLVQHDAEFCRDLYLDDRLVDRITSPFLREELLARVDALIRVRSVILRDSPGGAAGERPSAGRGLKWRGLGGRITAWLGSRVPRYEKPLSPYLEVAARLAEWADRRDAFEPGHAERVTGVCGMIAEGMGLGDDETSDLLRAAMLHDIGKVALPIEMLHQKAPLQESQKRLIRTHPKRGAALLRVLDGDNDGDNKVAATVLFHHERPDGNGYYGVPASETPRPARILALAEIYDAMTSSRLKQRMTSDRALGTLRERKGETVDTDCVEALVDKLKPRPRTIPLAHSPY